MELHKHTHNHSRQRQDATDRTSVQIAPDWCRERCDHVVPHFRYRIEEVVSSVSDPAPDADREGSQHGTQDIADRDCDGLVGFGEGGFRCVGLPFQHRYTRALQPLRAACLHRQMMVKVGEALFVKLVEPGRFRGQDHEHDGNDCKHEEDDGYDGVCPLEFAPTLFRRILSGCG